MINCQSKSAASLVLAAAALLTFAACAGNTEQPEEYEPVSALSKTCIACAPITCTRPGFSGPPAPTVSGATMTAASDLDGDGKADLAVANTTGVSVLVNRGNGLFAAEVAYPFSGGATSIATGDFDEDGALDLVITSGSRIGVLFNLGKGILTPPLFLAIASAGTSVASGDFDGDGTTDVAVTNGNGVSVMLNAGGGSFFMPVTYPTGSGAQSVTISDFNGDGKPDLAIANPASNSVSVLLNLGSGTFAAGASYAAGRSPVSVAASDFNGDGKPDLAVANLDDDSVGILLNKGSGLFAAQVRYPMAVGLYPEWVTVGDFNGDGSADVAVATQNNPAFPPGGVIVLTNKGDGTFALSTDHTVNGYADSVTAGDFDGDGRADLAVANSSVSGLGVRPLSVFINQGAKFFGARAREGFVAVGDLNGDSKLDLVARKPGGSGVDIMLNQTGGGYSAPTSYPTTATVDLVAVRDINGDGKPDIIVTHFAAGTVGVLLNLGGGALSAEIISSAGYPAGFYAVQSLQIADLNGDGKLDLVVANENSKVGDGSIGVLFNLGRSQFAQEVTFKVSDRPSSVSVGDVNGDGNLDLVVATYYGETAEVLLNLGGGKFAPRVGYKTGFRLTAAELGDLNGDGKLDLIVANAGTSMRAGASMSVFLNLGTGAFGAPTNYDTSGNSGSVAVGDFDGDAKLDVAVGSGFGGGVSLLVNSGAGALGPPLVYNTGVLDGPVAARDFNGDGKLDLAVSGQNGTSILLGQCFP